MANAGSAKPRGPPINHRLNDTAFADEVFGLQLVKHQRQLARTALMRDQLFLEFASRVLSPGQQPQGPALERQGRATATASSGSAIGLGRQPYGRHVTVTGVSAISHEASTSNRSALALVSPNMNTELASAARLCTGLVSAWGACWRALLAAARALVYGVSWQASRYYLHSCFRPSTNDLHLFLISFQEKISSGDQLDRLVGLLDFWGFFWLGASRAARFGLHQRNAQRLTDLVFDLNRERRVLLQKFA